MYEYAATVVRVVDGDTVDVLMDLGLDVRMHQRLRLTGINAPETSTAAGKKARDWLKQYLLVGDTVIVRTTKDRREKYGRYLATIQAAPTAWTGTLPIDVSTEMIKAGHAQPYDGGAR